MKVTSQAWAAKEEAGPNMRAVIHLRGRELGSVCLTQKFRTARTDADRTKSFSVVSFFVVRPIKECRHHKVLQALGSGQVPRRFLKAKAVKAVRAVTARGYVR